MPLITALLLGLSILLSPFTAVCLRAEQALPVSEVKRDEPVDFQEEILPLLRRGCIACHNTSEAESDLILETPQTILQGGAEGPGVVPGNADESLVFQLAAHRRESFMPPKDNEVGADDFTAEELGLIKLWIDQGAKGGVTSRTEAIAWQPLPAGFNPIYAVAVSPHGRFVAAGRANQIFMYSVLSQQQLGRLTDPELLKAGDYELPGVAHRDVVQSLAFSPSGKRLASGGFGSVKIWRPDDNLPQEVLPKAEGDIRKLVVSTDQRFAAVAQAVAEDNDVIQLYDLARGKHLHTVDNLTSVVTDIAFNADASRLAIGTGDGVLRLWNVADGLETGRLHWAASLTAVSFTNDGQHLITAGNDYLIRTWAIAQANPPSSQPEQSDRAAAAPIKELPGHSGEIVDLVPVPNHPTQFISASHDGTARFWDAAAGNEIRSLNHGGPLCDVAVGADSMTIATASQVGTVKLWNAQDGKQLVELTSDVQDSDRQDDLQWAIKRAQLHLKNATSDLEKALKKQQAEMDNADKAVVEEVRLEFELKQKIKAAEEAVAAKDAAAKELATLQTQLTEAEVANEKADQQAKPAAKQKLAKITQQVKTAERGLTKLTPLAEKAIEDKRNAEGELEAARHAVARAQQAIVNAADALPRLEQTREQRKDEQQKAEDLLTQTQQQTNSRSELIRDLEVAKAAADRARIDAQNRLQNAGNPLGGAQSLADTASARLTQLEQQLSEAVAAADAESDETAKGAPPAIIAELTAAHAEAARLAAEAAEQFKTATAQQTAAAKTVTTATKAFEVAATAGRVVAEDAQKSVQAATDAKTAADRAASDLENRNKAAVAAKKAAASSLAAAQSKLQQAQHEAGKAIAQAELDIATKNQASADKKAAETAAALADAVEAKTAAEAALKTVKSEAQRLQEVANETRAEAQNALDQARSQLAQADAAAGGLIAQVSTAAERSAAADADLAEVRPPVQAVAFSPDGTQLAVVSDRGQIVFCSSKTGKRLHAFLAPQTRFVAAAYLNSERLLTATADGSLVSLKSVPNWTLQHHLGSPQSGGTLTDRVTALDFSPDGQWLATGGGTASRNGELKLWNAENGQLVRAISEAHSDTVLSIKFSPAGKYLASGGADRFVRVFEVETGQLVKSFEGHTHHVLGVDWRADGRLLVTSGADNVIRVWDFATGEQARAITGFDKEITAVTFLGVSDNFVISNGNKQVVTRNTNGGGGPNFAGATDYMYAVDASRDGKTVVAAGQDSVLRIWDQQGKEIATFAPLSPESAQPAER